MMAERDGIKPVFLLVFHVLTFSVYVFGLYYDTFYLPLSQHRSTYGGRFKFLTFWNELIQTFFFGYSIINDIFGSNVCSNDKPDKLDKKVERRSKLQCFRDLFSATVVFPTGLFVVITFWGLYAIDREIIFPKALDAIIPAWLNHIWHTSIVLFLAVEKFFICHQYPSRKNGLGYSLGFILLYLIWILWIAFHADIWVYPVLAVLDWPMRCAFLLTCGALFVITYIVGEYVNKILWGPSSVTSQVVASETKKTKE